MALNFPNNPTANQTYVLGDKSWKWNGYAWKMQDASSTANIELSIFNTVADGVKSTFDLSFTPIMTSMMLVTIGGIVQPENEYAVNTGNSTISFTSPPPASENVRVVGYKTAIPYYVDAANSAGASIQTYNGLGDGVTPTFSLGFNPYAANSIFVTVGGIVQPDNAYSVNTVNNTISFGTPPGNNENIRVVGFSKVNPFVTYYASHNVSVSVFETTANGNTSSFDLGWNPQAKEFITVSIDGIVQPLTAYSVNTTANTITFDAAPANGELVRAATFYTTVNPFYYNPANVTVSTFETTANGLVSSFALNFNPSSNQAVMVSIDGVVQAPSSYSVSNTSNTITFLSTPANGEYITVTSYGAVNVYMINDNTVTFDKLHTSVRSVINLTSYTVTTANDASNLAQYAANTSNAALLAYNTANAAFIQANAAFNTANAAATTGKAIAMSIVFGG